MHNRTPIITTPIHAAENTSGQIVRVEDQLESS